MESEPLQGNDTS